MSERASERASERERERERERVVKSGFENRLYEADFPIFQKVL